MQVSSSKILAVARFGVIDRCTGGIFADRCHSGRLSPSTRERLLFFLCSRMLKAIIISCAETVTPDGTMSMAREEKKR